MIRRPSFDGSAPLLTLVATPIGNLAEISERAKEVLSDADVVGCEDTRVAGFLLNRLGIRKPLVKVEKHNEEEGASRLLREAADGGKVAYVSDAGYPGLSDPGERLVKAFLGKGYRVCFVNGPCAFLPALLGSGLETAHFYFEGFLPSKPAERRKRLALLGDYPCTTLYYEAPHRLAETLSDMLEAMGNRKAVLARELTKLHEEYIEGTLEELRDYASEKARGEYVVVVEGKPAKEAPIGEEEIRKALEDALGDLRGKDAVSYVSNNLGVPKKRVYSVYLSLRGRE